MIDDESLFAYRILLRKSDEGIYAEEDIEDAAERALTVLDFDEQTAAAKKKWLIRWLKTKVNTRVSSSAAIYGKDSVNWLDGKRTCEIGEHGFWGRYKKYLENERSQEEAYAVDRETNDILGHLTDPKTTTPQQKKGLVIGDVQSGKTSNYAGLICKAADSGYKIIIVIAGVLDSLRAQTQERLEHNFVGSSSNENADPNDAHGVSIYGDGDNKNLPDVKVMTDRVNDFNKRDVAKLPPNFNHSIALFVIKKNVNTLKHVIDFCTKRLSDKEKTSLPALIIDDEADNAGPNVKSDDEPSAINAGIRNLLSIFSINSYVGYTATPYANIFINPYVSGDPDATQDNMLNQDLFPKDFIYCLGRPSAYIGAARLFESDEDSADYDETCNTIQEIREEKDFIDKLKKKEPITTIPDSLKEAIRTFVIARAIRTLRSHDQKHCSMLIHVTMRQHGHSEIYHHVKKYIETVKKSIKAYIMLKFPHKEDPNIHDLYNTWLRQYEYTNIEETWEEICHVLGTSNYMNRFKIYKENSTVDKKLRLDYSKEKGLTPIVIGGNSLARGLTLEGLCTTYFLRVSKQYDTLMQMGRWFGYRDRYADICRVFTTKDIVRYFAAISRATDELKDSIRLMNNAGKTPLDFGLRVRNSVGGLLVTARNKMRSAETRVEWLDYTGNLLESYSIPAAKTKIEKNNQALHNFIKILDAHYKRRIPDTEKEEQCGIIWENVNWQDVQSYINETDGMMVSPYINNDLLLDFVKKQEHFDVCLITAETAKTVILHNGEKIAVPSRITEEKGGQYLFKKNHPFGKNHEMGYQDKDTIEQLKKQYIQDLLDKERTPKSTINKNDIPGKYYRALPGRKNLMMVSFVYVPTIEKAHEIEAMNTNGNHDKNAEDTTTSTSCTVMASIYGFSFSHNSYATGEKQTWTVNSVQLKLEQLNKTQDDIDPEEEY